MQKFLQRGNLVQQESSPHGNLALRKFSYTKFSQCKSFAKQNLVTRKSCHSEVQSRVNYASIECLRTYNQRDISSREISVSGNLATVKFSLAEIQLQHVAGFPRGRIFFSVKFLRINKMMVQSLVVEKAILFQLQTIL